jgi:2,3-bisphosphoglycerate-dependent phosphoglycerate mutase
MGKLILLRHGQSEWNKRNVFTGWIDIPLSAEGIEESLSAGQKMAHIVFDEIYVSTLVRAQMTLFLAMSKNKSGKVPCLIHEEEGRLREWGKNYNAATAADCIPVFSAWELNERMYGELQGLNKQETVDRFGAEQVKLWRRSYDTPPPQGESLATTANRTIPYLQQRIIPALQKGKNVLVSAHGNSLRAIVMFIEKLSHEQVLALEIATGDPLAYVYREGEFRKGTLT